MAGGHCCAIMGPIVIVKRIIILLSYRYLFIAIPVVIPWPCLSWVGQFFASAM
jgi:hypothetical protein